MAVGQIDSLGAALELAVQSLRAFGHSDTVVVPSDSPTSGYVRAATAIACVRFDAVTVDRAALQALVRARGGQNGLALYYFTGVGFATSAVELARRVGMALFKYQLDGSITAENEAADVALARTDASSGELIWSTYSAGKVVPTTPPTPPPVSPPPSGWFRRSMRWLGRMFRTVGWEAFRSDEPNRPADLMTGGQLAGAGVGVGAFGLLGVIVMLSELSIGVPTALGGAAMYAVFLGFGVWAVILGRRRKAIEAAARNPGLSNPTDLR